MAKATSNSQAVNADGTLSPAAVKQIVDALLIEAEKAGFVKSKPKAKQYANSGGGMIRTRGPAIDRGTHRDLRDVLDWQQPTPKPSSAEPLTEKQQRNISLACAKEAIKRTLYNRKPGEDAKIRYQKEYAEVVETMGEKFAFDERLAALNSSVDEIHYKQAMPKAVKYVKEKNAEKGSKKTASVMTETSRLVRYEKKLAAAKTTEEKILVHVQHEADRQRDLGKHVPFADLYAEAKRHFGVK